LVLTFFVRVIRWLPVGSQCYITSLKLERVPEHSAPRFSTKLGPSSFIVLIVMIRARGVDSTVVGSLGIDAARIPDDIHAKRRLNVQHAPPIVHQQEDFLIDLTLDRETISEGIIHHNVREEVHPPVIHAGFYFGIGIFCVVIRIGESFLAAGLRKAIAPEAFSRSVITTIHDPNRSRSQRKRRWVSAESTWRVQKAL
jgi:hypothetical protein